MKKINRLLISLILLAILFGIYGCSDRNTPEEEIIQDLFPNYQTIELFIWPNGRGKRIGLITIDKSGLLTIDGSKDEGSCFDGSFRLSGEQAEKILSLLSQIKLVEVQERPVFPEREGTYYWLTVIDFEGNISVAPYEMESARDENDEKIDLFTDLLIEVAVKGKADKLTNLTQEKTLEALSDYQSIQLGIQQIGTLESMIIEIEKSGLITTKIFSDMNNTQKTESFMLTEEQAKGVIELLEQSDISEDR